MYIPEFWAGVICTVLLELALVIIYGLKKGGKQ